MIKFLYLLFITAVATLSAAEPPRRVIVLGDSIAAGFGVDAEEAFPAILQQKIDAAHLRYHVVNAGVSGDTTAGGLRRISWVLKKPVDLLLIELGGNDGLRGINPEETAKNLQSIIDKTKAQYPDVKIVVAGMQMPANMGPEYTKRYREVFADVAKKNNAMLIPFLLEGVGARADLNQADRIHPNPGGHKIVAENVWKVIRPVLAEEAKAARSSS
jgi:acyl-CoA thioesterase-1